jgi:hypothetical protein
MSAVRLGTKDNCAGEDQQQFSSQSSRDTVRCSRVTTSRGGVTLFLVEKKVQLKTRKNKNMVMGHDTKNDCADEDQQQFTGLGWTGPVFNRLICLWAVVSTVGRDADIHSVVMFIE